MNEQVSELKTKLESFKTDESLANGELKEKYGEVMVKLDSYKDREIDDSMISEVLKIQSLVQELENA